MLLVLVFYIYIIFRENPKRQEILEYVWFSHSKVIECVSEGETKREREGRYRERKSERQSEMERERERIL